MSNNWVQITNRIRIKKGLTAISVTKSNKGSLFEKPRKAGKSEGWLLFKRATKKVSNLVNLWYPATDMVLKNLRAKFKLWPNKIKLDRSNSSIGVYDTNLIWTHRMWITNPTSEISQPQRLYSEPQQEILHPLWKTGLKWLTLFSPIKFPIPPRCTS